jgi:hypothetical protein
MFMQTKFYYKIRQCTYNTTFSVVYYGCVPVFFPYRFATRMRHIILSSVASLALPYFSTLSHKWHDFRKKVIEYEMCVLNFLKILSKNVSLTEKFSKAPLRMYIGLHVQFAPFLPDFNKTLIFWAYFSKNTKKLHFIKIRPVGAELFRTDRRTRRS